MEDNKDTEFLTEEETKKIVSEQFEKLAPSFFQKTLNKIGEKFAEKEFIKAINELTEDSKKRNEELQKKIEEFVDQSKNKTIETHKEYEIYTRNFISEIKPLFLDEIKRQKDSLEDDFNQRKANIDVKMQEVSDRENAIISREASFKVESEGFAKIKAEIEEKAQKIEAAQVEFKENETAFLGNVERHNAQVKKHLEDQESFKELKKSAEDTKNAATDALSKLIPDFVSKNETLRNFFIELSEDGQYSGNGVLLMAQLNMLQSAIKPGGERYLKNCLKEIGRAVYSYCYDNNKDISELPMELANVINSHSSIIEAGIKLEAPFEGAPIDSSWMFDQSTGRGGGSSVRRIITWALRETQRGTALSKAEIES
jgi:hypothetical protein